MDGWMVGERGIKANSAQFGWGLAELGNKTYFRIAIFVKLRGQENLALLKFGPYTICRLLWLTKDVKPSLFLSTLPLL